MGHYNPENLQALREIEKKRKRENEPSGDTGRVSVKRSLPNIRELYL
jgi:hypothetical protein